MRQTLWLILVASAGLAQKPQEAQIVIHESEATVTVDSGRPVDAIVALLVQRFGINVSSEDPAYQFSGDVQDVTASASKSSHPTRRVLIPRTVHLEVRFALGPNGKPHRIAETLQAVADAANARFPFAFELRSYGDAYALVPTRTRDRDGKIINVLPLLDRLVTIPEGVRPIHESARLMAESLSAQTGGHVGCCQAFVAGVPWGLQPIAFGANAEPARRILRRLIRSENPNVSWHQRCDPGGGWCFIQIVPIPRVQASFP